jgi:poly(3-hydroxybutyrate) depolymerase
VFIMHGALRNGDVYRDDIAPLAEAHGFIAVAPLFSSEDFPGAEGYILGGATDRDGNPKPRAEWVFSVIEPLFDTIRAEHASTRTRYSIFGHSGGAQFLHRFLLAVPDARVDRAVAANAGWYTMPDPSTPWPFGLAGAPFPVDTADWFAAPMTVLLGTADTLRTDNLNQTPEADAQGPHRLARGHAFFGMAQITAAAAETPFSWSLDFVEGVGHDHTPMAAGAIDHLLAPEDRAVQPAGTRRRGGGG